MKSISTKVVKDISNWHDSVIYSSIRTWSNYQKKFSDPEWTPMAHVLYPCSKGYCHDILMMPFKNIEEKGQAMDFLKEYCIHRKAIGYAFAYEAWMKMVAMDDKETKNLYMSGQVTPSQAPDRIEIFAIIYETAHKTTQRSYRIIRPKSGKKPYLKPLFDEHPDSGFMGRMTHILAKDPQLPLN